MYVPVNQTYHQLFARSEIDRSRMRIRGMLMASFLLLNVFWPFTTRQRISYLLMIPVRQLRALPFKRSLSLKDERS